MVIVKRANALLEVKDSEVDYYVDLGYQVLDSEGRVIRNSIPSDKGTLKNAYITHEAKIKELQTQIEELKAELAKYQETSVDTPKKRGRKSGQAN